MTEAHARAMLRDLEPRADAGSAATADERLARARWTVLAEPGDGIAGLAIARLGAVTALEAALQCDAAPPELEISERDWERARARWMPRRDGYAYPLELARRVGARLLVPGDTDWPARLDDLGVHAPAALWVRGRIDALARLDPAVALVGARAATAYGVHVAADLAADLAADGATIVSGAAMGIDAAAHRASLAVEGRGVAVLAGGVEKAYPSGHAQLLTSLLERGVVVSEVPCGTAPTKWRFLQRNRLIAGLADATVVVEAGWRSGSLNTAGHAAALGRALGAVPGPVTSAASAGCHRVLREFDGVCVTGADDVREMLGQHVDEAGGAGGTVRTSEQIRVLDALDRRAARSVAEVARRAGLAVDEVAATLGLLSLEQQAVSDHRGWRAGPS